MFTDKELLECAVRFKLGDNLYLKRDSEGWVIWQQRGPMNPWYLNNSGEPWRYKHGDAFPTRHSALLRLAEVT